MDDKSGGWQGKHGWHGWHRWHVRGVTCERGDMIKCRDAIASKKHFKCMHVELTVYVFYSFDIMNKSWYFLLQQELKKCKCPFVCPFVRSKLVQSSQSQVFLRLLGCQVLAYFVVYSRSLKYFVLLASANTQGEWLSYRREVRNEILDQQREVSRQEYNVMAACYLHRHITSQSDHVF